MDLGLSEVFEACVCILILAGCIGSQLARGMG